MGLGDKLFLPDKETVDKINLAVGSSADSVNANSLWGKIKQLLTDWTTVRATKLDSLDVTLSSRASQVTSDGIKTVVETTNIKVGTNSDASGTGTIFAWLKKLGDAISTLTTNFTSARATKLDNIGTFPVANGVSGNYNDIASALADINQDVHNTYAKANDANTNAWNAYNAFNGRIQTAQPMSVYPGTTVRYTDTAEAYLAGSGQVYKAFRVPNIQGVIKLLVRAKTDSTNTNPSLAISVDGHGFFSSVDVLQQQNQPDSKNWQGSMYYDNTSYIAARVPYLQYGGLLNTFIVALPVVPGSEVVVQLAGMGIHLWDLYVYYDDLANNITTPWKTM